MALDRSKFKATVVATMVEADKEVESALGRTRGERADQLSIEEGTNKFRIYPPHPEEDGGGEVFAEPVAKCFLPMMVEDKDQQGNVQLDGNGKPKMKESSRPVFNSRIHGGTLKDLVEEYRKFSDKRAVDLYGEDKKKKDEYLAPVIGKYSKVASERIAGIQDRQTWVLYADKISTNRENIEAFKFGRLEFGKAVKDRLNKLSAIEGENEPMGTDPFTPIDAGRAAVVVYNKQASKPADFYTTEMDNSTVKTEINGKMYPIQKEYPLTDEQLENFFKFPTLKSLFRNSFKRKDFELQLRGLEFFDGKYKMGIWTEPEWADIVEEISAYYPEEDPEDEDGPVTAKVTDKEVVTSEEEEEEPDEFDGMSRDELKAFNKTNSCGVVVTKSMTEAKLREAVRTAYNAANLGTDEEEEEEDDTSKEETLPVKQAEIIPPTTGVSMKERLAAIKNKNNA